MSAAKRRRARQIARMVRMDQQYLRQLDMGRKVDSPHIIANMRALGRAMTRRGLRARALAALHAARIGAGWEISV